ncbi:MAG: hypothetical protein NTY12_00295 [Candidatus Falkowbacteria bacterium]|nr:hypothetical protein [Candidatus Falkowbacteria bacterium]
MSVNHQKFGTISWKSYQLIRKKAMEQELSWSGLVISLSIAFFVVAGCAGFLRLAYTSIENNNNSAKQLDGERLIQSGALVKLFVNRASAATLDLKAVPIKDTNHISIEQGKAGTQIVKLKNTGKDSWKPGEVNLETGLYLKTFSKLQTSTWLKFYRPVSLTKEVKPGQSVDISFPIKAPTDFEGTIQENFQLVRDERPIAGSLVRFFITVTKPVVASSTTIQNQVKSNTTPAAPIAPIVAPKVDFCISMINDATSYQNCNTSAQESPNDNGIIFSPLLTKEPNIRVGLFNSDIAQRITFNTIFDVYAGKDVLFSGVQPNIFISASFDAASKRYAVRLVDMAKTTASPLRFVPRDSINGVATLLDSKSTDNRFRNVIEMRYTEPAKKVWLINELPLESYLKGLAETTNASPIEFQKVMATTARTYALYHYLRGVEYNIPDASTKHADDHFHIDAYYDQVYRGYNSELRMSGLSAAIDATRGVTVAYAGKPVVTPYFSNSDGRTRDWTEVWGGAIKPWLRSVLVPQDTGKNLFGHGVGMSARGALLMVTSGTSWQNVLKYFYTGIDLLKIY